LKKQHGSGRISATADGAAAVKDTEVSLICVGTPPTATGHLDLQAVFKVAEEIGDGIRSKNGFHIIVIRSTVIPGTNEEVQQIVARKSGKTPNRDFAVVSNPEFLREGSAVYDFYHPPYTLIGSDNQSASDKMEALYEAIDAPFIVTQIKTAELVKYVNNAFHALKVTFANEVGNISKKLGIDSHELMEIFCLDTKLNLSSYYLKPGFCYGGSCLPKDLRALRLMAHDNYLSLPLLENIERSNDHQRDLIFDQIIGFQKKNIGILGLSFKPGTDDLRDSPIIDIVERLLGKGYGLTIYDPHVQITKLIGANREYVLSKIPYISNFIVSDPQELVDNSDVIIVVNKEEEFRNVLAQVPESKAILDLVNMDFPSKTGRCNYRGIAW
jgi:GDP-mannose 6-dehydrogenase